MLLNSCKIGNGFFLAMIVMIGGCTATSYSSQIHALFSGNHVVITSEHHYDATNSEKVEIISNAKTIQKPYHKIGVVSICQHNLARIKRQKATLIKLLQQYAASIGGQAVIHLHSEQDFEVGDVIRWSAKN